MRFVLYLSLIGLASVAISADNPSGTILNLYDAFGKDTPGTEFAWGYSALVHFEGKTILFDAGGDADRFGRNANALGVNLKAVDYGVLSHRHADHASGFDYVFKQNPSLQLYLPDDLMLGGTSGLKLPSVPHDVLESLPPEQRYFRGEPRTASGPWGSRFWHARTQPVSDTRQIAPGVFLIATRSPLMGDFSRARPADPPDLNGLPELSLALVTSKGIVLVTGCSHSGIEAIVRKTRDTVGKDIQLVIGGFHLLPNSAAEIRQLALTMKNDLGVRRVAPAHCTGMLAFQIFREIYGNDFVPAGLASKVQFSR